MLVGESKPYCTAIAWVDKENYNQQSLASIDKAIAEMNKRLSNPEKIKRWALLKNNLSIEKGELTPNLKLKRNFILIEYLEIINALYEGAIPQGEVYINGMEKSRK
jgi:long-chain acyl-CoA synthetase